MSVQQKRQPYLAGKFFSCSDQHFQLQNVARIESEVSCAYDMLAIWVTGNLIISRGKSIDTEEQDVKINNIRDCCTTIRKDPRAIEEEARETQKDRGSTGDSAATGRCEVCKRKARDRITQFPSVYMSGRRILRVIPWHGCGWGMLCRMDAIRNMRESVLLYLLGFERSHYSVDCPIYCEICVVYFS